MTIRRSLIAATLVAPVLARAQQPDAVTFYLLLRTDTIFVERQSRTPSRVDGEFVDRTSGAHTSFTALLTPDALVARFEATSPPRAGDTTVQRQTLTFLRDS